MGVLGKNSEFGISIKGRFAFEAEEITLPKAWKSQGIVSPNMTCPLIKFT